MKPPKIYERHNISTPPGIYAEAQKLLRTNENMSRVISDFLIGFIRERRYPITK